MQNVKDRTEIQVQQRLSDSPGAKPSAKSPVYNIPKLSAAQIENRRYSIFIKNLSIDCNERQSKETKETEDVVRQIVS